MHYNVNASQNNMLQYNVNIQKLLRKYIKLSRYNMSIIW